MRELLEQWIKLLDQDGINSKQKVSDAMNDEWIKIRIHEDQTND